MKISKVILAVLVLSFFSAEQVLAQRTFQPEDTDLKGRFPLLENGQEVGNTGSSTKGGGSGTEKGATALASGRGGLGIDQQFTRPRLSINSLDDNGEVKEDYDIPQPAARTGSILHTNPSKLGLDIAFSNAATNRFDIMEQSQLYETYLTAYGTSPATGASIYATIMNADDMAKGQIASLSDFRSQLTDENPFARQTILNALRGCIEEQVGEAGAGAAPGSGSKSLHEAIAKCMGDSVTRPNRQADINQAQGDDLMKITQTSLYGDCRDGILDEDGDEEEMTVMNLLFACSIANGGDSARWERFRDSAKDLYGDGDLKLGENRDEGIADGSAIFTKWEIVPTAPEQSHAEILHEWAEARYKELLGMLALVCEEDQNAFDGGTTFVQWLRGDEKEPFLANAEVKKYMNVFSIEGYQTPAVVYRGLVDSFTRKFRVEGQEFDCDKIEDEGDIDSIDETSPYYPVYQRYWNFAHFIATAQLIQTYIQSAKIIDRVAVEGHQSTVDLRMAAHAIMAAATGYPVESYLDLQADNLNRFMEFLGQLYIEHQQESGRAGSQITGIVSAGSGGKQRIGDGTS